MNVRRQSLRSLTFLIAIQCASWLALAAVSAHAAPAESKPIVKDIPYKTGDKLSDYEKTRCKLDVYLPAQRHGFATLVWFHGGGLTAGQKDGADAQKIYTRLTQDGIGVVVPNYRLSPRIKYPAYIEDAAAAVAWTRTHIGEYGGDAGKLFIGGHSAGGYLTLMLGMDDHYLKDRGVPPQAIAGFIPVSGQTMTHYTIRAERGIGQFTITADEAAPVHFARPVTQPILVLYADHDMAARAEENAYFVALLAGAGHKRVTGKCIADRTHGSIFTRMVEENDPTREAILEFIKTR